MKTNEASTSVPVITLDGPGGSGKGTVGRRLARELGWHFLDSGALYRLVALAAQRRGVALDDTDALASLARDLPVVFEPGEADEGRILFDGADVGDAIRTEEWGERASRVAMLPEVRSALLARQREFCRPPGLVADGRDMGSVVFPGAVLKIFLTASPHERALRRYNQLKEKGLSANLATLSDEIARRDTRDAVRAVAPLRPAPDAHVLDTTGVAIAEVVARIRGLL
ncbi:MAG TPA: (d)CMP kinase [Gammaproteobacteria bacterium]|nr:(d)CMP kinase [Gammaproteobacteria bacterium]